MRASLAVNQQVQYHGKHTPDTPIGAFIPHQHTPDTPIIPDQHTPDTPIGAFIPHQKQNQGKFYNLIKLLDFYINIKMYYNID